MPMTEMEMVRKLQCQPFRKAGFAITASGAMPMWVVNVYLPDDGDGREIYVVAPNRKAAQILALKDQPKDTIAMVSHRWDLRMSTHACFDARLK
jgi:hypothetical protein